jgi:hypothetical protein
MRSTPLSHDSRHRNPSIPAVITPTKRLLPSERAALGQSRLATSGLAPVNALAHALILCPIVLDLQDLRAALADDDCVGVREDGGDGEASGALDVHEEGAGSGHEGLELVLAGLTRHLLVAGRGRRGGNMCVRGRGGVEKVNCENLEPGQFKIFIKTSGAQGTATRGCKFEMQWRTPRVSCARSQTPLAHS